MFRLTISLRKTKTQVFDTAELAKKVLFSIQGYDIENVLNFIYLRHVITTDENNWFTEHCIASAISKFNELGRVSTNVQVQEELLEVCVRSRLT